MFFLEILLYDFLGGIGKTPFFVLKKGGGEGVANICGQSFSWG